MATGTGLMGDLGGANGWMTNGSTSVIAIEGIGVASKVSLAGALLCFSMAITAAQWRTDGALVSRLVISDNIDLRPPGFEQSGAAFQLLPYLSLSGEGRRATVNLRYAPSTLLYTHAQDGNSVFHILDARAEADVVADYLTVSVTGKANQALAGPLGRAGFDAVGGVDAYRQTASISVQPKLNLPVVSGRFATLSVVPGFGTVFEASTDGRSVNRTGTSNSSISLRSGSAFNSVSWSIEWSRRVFNVDSDDGIGRLSATFGASFGPRYALITRLGYEDGTYVSSNGQTRGPTWTLIGRWTPSPRSTFEFSYGRAYYGTLIDGSLSHRHKRWAFNGTISTRLENTATEIEQLVVVPQTNVFGEPINQTSPEEVFATTQEVTLGSDQTFVSYRVRGGVGYRGRRTSVTGSLWWQSREYGGSRESTTDWRMNLSATRRFSSKLSGGPNIDFWQADQSAGGFNQYRVGLNLRNRLGSRTSVGLVVERSERRADSSVNSFAENRVSLDFSVDL